MPPLKKSEKRLLLLIGIAVIIFLWMDPYYWWTDPPVKPVTANSATQPVTTGAAPTAKPPEPQPTLAAQAQKRLDSLQKAGATGSGLQWDHDPFFSQIIEEEEGTGEEKFRLEGVLISGKKACALINGNVLAVGEEIDGWKVTEVTSSAVKLSRGGNMMRLRVVPRPPPEKPKPLPTQPRGAR